MRLKRSQPFLCFCFVVQVAWAHSKNDYLKNGQRTNPKKYHPTNGWTVGTTTTTTGKPSLDRFGVDGVKLRHSSKFPHFDQIKSRINSLDSGQKDSNILFGGSSRYSDNSRYFSDSKWGASAPRLRHHGWSNRARTTTTTTTTPSPDEDLFNNYGELDGDEQMEDDYPDDIFETVDDDDNAYGVDYNFQAEEATSTESSPTERRIYSSLSEYKWEQLGTMERVQQARRNYMQQKDTAKKSPEEKRISSVVEHYIRVKNSGQCKKPIPKVIPVHTEHPDSSVTYIPHCTILHRCAEDTGCCKHDTTCQYKERVEVTLDFYVKYIGVDNVKQERLTFFNHTECECREKTQENPVEHSSTTERQKRVAESNNLLFNSEVNLRSAADSIINMPENLIKCKCPKEFIPKIKHGSRCYCDCNPNNEDCLRMKKGKEYNSLVDRLCIQRKECGIVSCEYGPYDKLKGRCPRYDEA